MKSKLNIINKKNLIAIFLFAILISFVSAENSFLGGDLFYDLLSPSQASSSASFVNIDSPLAAMNNPAATGFLQRVTLEAAYTGINGYDSYDGWGNIIAAGISYPGKAGVINGSLFFVNSNFDFYNKALLTGVNISFAKDIYENLSIGLGINLGYGKEDDSDWMLNADLGFIHYPNNFLNHKSFRWGAVFKNIGKGFSPDSDFSLPPSFTPGIGAGINVFKFSKFAGDLTADIFMPSFNNVVIDIGNYLILANSLKLSFAARANFDTLNDDGFKLASFSPTFGLSYGFKTNLESLNSKTLRDRDWTRTEVIADAAFTQVAKNIQGYGAGVRIPLGFEDTAGPSITIDYGATQYISPNNYGANNELVFPVQIEDRRYVKGYTLNITDENGNIIRTYENKEDRPENVNIKNIIDRILYIKSGVAVPDTFSWDGLDNERIPAPDGTYNFSITSWDDNNNSSTASGYNVVVDTLPPELTIEKSKHVSDMIFSPNNDGIKDFFTITQKGSAEKSWKAEIYDNNNSVVKTYNFTEAAPKDINWDGRGDNGKLLPDGVYSYRITGEDYAGNKTTDIVENIIISTIETPIALRISDYAFSPGNAGAKSLLTFFMDVPVKNGIESWIIDIISDKDKKNSATIEGQFVIPDHYLYDGKTSDGSFLADGKYQARLQIIYEHGNMPEVYSPNFMVDTVAPTASVTAEYTVFSPNGDGNKDTLVLKMKTSQEDLWEGTVYNRSENPLQVFQWKHGVPETFSWGGTGSDGRLLEDGNYYFVLSSTDEAGNKGGSARLNFTIDTEDTPVVLSRNFDAFSPNNDGVKDIISFFPRVTKNDGIEKYSLSVINDKKETVFKQDGTVRIPERINWDGKIAPAAGSSAGKIAEGKYTAKIDILYVNGNNPSAVSEPFALDITFPKIEVELDYPVFSPNGDGNKDFITFKMTDPSSEDEWETIVTDSKGAVVRKRSQKGKPDNYIWDGKDQNGNVVKNGIYKFTIQSQDAAGNKTVKTIDNIEVDTRLTQAIASIDRDGFSPNNDNIADTMKFNLLHTKEAAVESWNLKIISSAGKAVKTFINKDLIPDTITWDGKDEAGKITDDIYRAEFAVRYKKGDIKISETRSFILDTTPPKAEVVLTPYPFSPDNDGIDDELSIIINLEDKSGIRDWEMQIKDPYMNSFKKFAGKGTPPKKITWDGMSDGGELVQAAEDYPYTLNATDIFGNSVAITGLVAVDILVLRDGDNLKIKISSINFAPNSPELVTDIPEIKEKNEKIINRLSEILKKYSSYKIKIEGHANNLSWYDTAKAAVEERDELIPLSQARCETVKRILTQKGIAADRMSTLGVGGTKPIVPFGDTVNRWKNRRVEFILIK